MENEERYHIVLEHASVGKYRVRMIQDNTKPDHHPAFDIREYRHKPNFTGFTRNGIRLEKRSEVEALRNVLNEVLAEWPA